MSTFHPFPRLPYEIRSHIWTLMVRPRIVHVRPTKLHWSREIAYVASPTLPPPIMQVCHESRQHAPYQRGFNRGAEPRYTWVNFEIDMICIQGVDVLHQLGPYRLDIQRIRLMSDGSQDEYDYFFYWGVKQIDEFSILKEIHIVVDEAMPIWSTLFESNSWGSCPLENIRFIDGTTGLMMNGYQLTMVWDWTMVFSYEGVGNVQNIDNFTDEIEWALDDTHLTLSQIRDIE